MKRLLRKVHRFYFLGLLFLIFIIFYPGLWFAAKKGGAYLVWLMRIRRWIALSVSTLSGFRFHVEGEEDIDWNRPYLICSNHSSNLDIIALIIACKQNFSFVGKEELKSNPITGLFFRTIDIPVDRSSKISSYKAYSRAKCLLEEGRAVMIFPEGGISDHYPPKLQAFKNGAFKLAIEINVPVLPVVIHDAWKLFWDDGKIYGTRPGVCHLTLLQPIETDKLSTKSDELRENVFQAFQQSWKSKRSNIY